MAHLYSFYDFYVPYGNLNFILVLVLKFPGSLNLLFHNLSIHQFSRKNPSLAQFIPRIYNKIIIKILGYFWGVTSIIGLFFVCSLSVVCSLFIFYSLFFLCSLFVKYTYISI